MVFFLWLAPTKILKTLFWRPFFLLLQGVRTYSDPWRLGGRGVGNLYNLHASQNNMFFNIFGVHTGFLHFRHQRMDEALDNKLKFNNSERNNVTCLLENQLVPFRMHDKSNWSLDRGDERPIELLYLLKDPNPLLSDHTKTATVLKDVPYATQNDFIKATHEVIPDEISSRIQAKPLVAVMYDDV